MRAATCTRGKGCEALLLLQAAPKCSQCKIPHVSVEILDLHMSASPSGQNFENGVMDRLEKQVLFWTSSNETRCPTERGAAALPAQCMRQAKPASSTSFQVCGNASRMRPHTLIRAQSHTSPRRSRAVIGGIGALPGNSEACTSAPFPASNSTMPNLVNMVILVIFDSTLLVIEGNQKPTHANPSPSWDDAT